VGEICCGQCVLRSLKGSQEWGKRELGVLDPGGVGPPGALPIHGNLGKRHGEKQGSKNEKNRPHTLRETLARNYGWIRKKNQHERTRTRSQPEWG